MVEEILIKKWLKIGNRFSVFSSFFPFPLRATFSFPEFRYRRDFFPNLSVGAISLFSSSQFVVFFSFPLLFFPSLPSLKFVDSNGRSGQRQAQDRREQNPRKKRFERPLPFPFSPLFSSLPP